jgi:hypothetical protein
MNSLRWVLVFVVLLFLVGCGDDDTSPDNPLEAGGNSTLTLRLIDAPGDLAHAWVEITRITLHGETDDDAESNVTLFEGGTGMIDLLTLVDTAFELIN